MKILFATDNFYPNVNGAVRFVHGLINGLLLRGHEISVIAPSNKFKNTIVKHDGITIYGIQSIQIPKMIHPSGMRIPFVISPLGINKLVREIAPDVIHVQDHFVIGNMVIQAAKKINIPVVGANHFMPENIIHYVVPLDFAKKRLSGLAWKQFINIYEQADVVTSPTKTASNLLKKLGLKKQILTISCGVDLKRFNPLNRGRYLKKRYRINPSKQIILFVGRLDKEKNINILIKAFSAVIKSLPAQLVIAGKGKEKNNLVKLSADLGINKHVTFTGYVAEDDLPNLYNTADVFVIASTAELQSIATMEAMASGLPVIAARAIALPELVHDGKNGYLFDNCDEKKLTELLVRILSDPGLRRKMSQNSLKVINKHDLKKTVDIYEKLYLRLSA